MSSQVKNKLVASRITIKQSKKSKDQDFLII